ncbi:MAG TPA: hypothetical protein VGD65_09490 [Chryseosolibacter sp.]
MKTVHKTTLADAFSNPITRNLILILVTTLSMAVLIVTASIVIYNQF